MNCDSVLTVEMYSLNRNVHQILTLTPYTSCNTSFRAECFVILKKITKIYTKFSDDAGKNPKLMYCTAEASSDVSLAVHMTNEFKQYINFGFSQRHHQIFVLIVPCNVAVALYEEPTSSLCWKMRGNGKTSLVVIFVS